MDQKRNNCKKARKIWPKIVEVIHFWQLLPKNKQPRQGKVCNNTSYDHLFKVIKDPVIEGVVKVLFSQEVSKNPNDFHIIFQTDIPMPHFLTEILEELL